jgi:hypothetical protein
MYVPEYSVAFLKSVLLAHIERSLYHVGSQIQIFIPIGVSYIGHFLIIQWSRAKALRQIFPDKSWWLAGMLLLIFDSDIAHIFIISIMRSKGLLIRFPIPLYS